MLLVALSGILAAGVVDYFTGFELRVYPLYFVPIAYGAWRLSRRVALGLAFSSAVLWVAANSVAGGFYSHPGICVANFLSQFLAYLDLDDFKKVNDTAGHDEGDRVLAAVGDVLRRHTRKSDLVARLGGDEFVLLLMNTDRSGALGTLERIRDALRKVIEERSWPITVSVGALSFLEAPATIDEAMQAADALMYRAKSEGKNRVCAEIASSPAKPELADGGREPALRTPERASDP